MDIHIYVYLVAATLLLGWLMPQKGPKRKWYIILMAALCAFVCAFRYNHLTGDLMKYHFTFNQSVLYGWFSPEIMNGGRNFGFYWFLKLVNHLTGGDYQMVLVIIAVFCQSTVALLIYRYSPKPWISFLVWHALGFYIFGFSALKQAFAMGFIMLSLICILERRPGLFTAMVLLAGTIHMPALVFLPAYWLSKQKINLRALGVYLLVGVAVFLFKYQILDLISSIYYEDMEIMTHSGELGGRFVMILLIAICGIVLRGFRSGHFEALFHLMVVSAIIQMFAGFDNIFTRMSDYYFQFAVLYIPLIFYAGTEENRADRPGPMLRFDAPSMRIMAGVVCFVLLVFYWNYVLYGGQILTGTDDYLNFRFMWEVK